MKKTQLTLYSIVKSWKFSSNIRKNMMFTLTILFNILEKASTQEKQIHPNYKAKK